MTSYRDGSVLSFTLARGTVELRYKSTGLLCDQVLLIGYGIYVAEPVSQILNQTQTVLDPVVLDDGKTVRLSHYVAATRRRRGTDIMVRVRPEGWNE